MTVLGEGHFTAGVALAKEVLTWRKGLRVSKVQSEPSMLSHSAPPEGGSEGGCQGGKRSGEEHGGEKRGEQCPGEEK